MPVAVQQFQTVTVPVNLYVYAQVVITWHEIWAVWQVVTNCISVQTLNPSGQQPTSCATE